MDGIVLKKYINLKIQYFDSFKCSVFIKLIFAKFCRPLDFPGQLRFRLSELVLISGKISVQKDIKRQITKKPE